MLTAAPSFSLSTGHGSRTMSASTDAGGSFNTAVPAPDRWRLAADRAASLCASSCTGNTGSFKAGSLRSCGAGPSPTASQAADLLAEIDRVVSHTPSPAAFPAALPADSLAELLSLADLVASPAAKSLTHEAWQPDDLQQQQQAVQGTQQHRQQQQQQQQGQEHQERHRHAQPASPEAESTTAGRWNGLTASRPVALGTNPGSPASPLATFGFATQSPSPAGLLSSPGADFTDPVDIHGALTCSLAAGRVEIPLPSFQLDTSNTRCFRLGWFSRFCV